MLFILEQSVGLTVQAVSVDLSKISLFREMWNNRMTSCDCQDWLSKATKKNVLEVLEDAEGDIPWIGFQSFSFDRKFLKMISCGIRWIGGRMEKRKMPLIELLNP